jgi:hypothetical protein
MFVDSDDYVYPDIFTKVNEALQEHDYDVICFGYQLLQKGILTHRQTVDLSKGSYLGDDLKAIKPKLISRFGEPDFPASRWSKVFKAKLFKEFLKYSLDDIRDYEDVSITFPYVAMTNSLRVISDDLYVYRILDNSMSHNKDKLLSSYHDCIKVFNYFEENRQLFNFSDEMLDSMYLAGYMNIYFRAVRYKQYYLVKEVRKNQRLNTLIKKYHFKNKISGFLIKNNWYKTYNFLFELKQKIKSIKLI